MDHTVFVIGLDHVIYYTPVHSTNTCRTQERTPNTTGSVPTLTEVPCTLVIFEIRR